MTHNLTIVFEPGTDGWWVAEIAEIPGAISQGRTIDEARKNVLGALEDLLEARREMALQTAVAPTRVETLSVSV